MKRTLSGLVMVVALAGAVACASSPDSRFHTLVAHPGGTHRSARLRIQVRRPQLPRELDTNYIAQRRTPTELDFVTTERWGAPLEVVVRQTLVENLALRLPDALVYSEDGPIGVKPDVLIEAEFQRFGLIENERAKLEAHVAFRSPAPPSVHLERYSFTARVEAGDVDSRVEALSGLLGQLSNAVTEHLLDFETSRGNDEKRCAEGPRGDLPR